jgi:hypothetical protein
MKNAWKRHREIMKQNHLPYVNYTTFLSRVKNQRWNLYKAVHTPAKVHNRDRDRRRKAWFNNVKDRISEFFRTLFNLGCQK